MCGMCVCVCVCVCVQAQGIQLGSSHISPMSLKECLGRYFSGRADLNIIAEPGVCRGLMYCMCV